jgi:hypothetical protein
MTSHRTTEAPRQSAAIDHRPFSLTGPEHGAFRLNSTPQAPEAKPFDVR